MLFKILFENLFMILENFSPYFFMILKIFPSNFKISEIMSN